MALLITAIVIGVILVFLGHWSVASQHFPGRKLSAEVLDSLDSPPRSNRSDTASVLSEKPRSTIAVTPGALGKVRRRAGEQA